jgi:hypothetical protein
MFDRGGRGRDERARKASSRAATRRIAPVLSALERAAAGLGRLNRALLLACRLATILLCAAVTAVVAVGVFWRYVLNDALSWSEEVA